MPSATTTTTNGCALINPRICINNPSKAVCSKPWKKWLFFFFFFLCRCHSSWIDKKLLVVVVTTVAPAGYDDAISWCLLHTFPPRCFVLKKGRLLAAVCDAYERSSASAIRNQHHPPIVCQASSHPSWQQVIVLTFSSESPAAHLLLFFSSLFSSLSLSLGSGGL